MKKILIVAVVFVLTLAACSPAAPTGVPPEPVKPVAPMQATYTPYPTNTPYPTQQAAPQALAAAVPAAPASNCRDGSATGNPKNRIDRTPVGKAEYWTVQEISTKPGNGFGKFDRWVQVTPPLGNKDQVFNLKVETIHEVEYCGTAEAVKAYLSDPSHHIWAMRQSAADANGKIPPDGEIPVVLIDTTTGAVNFLVAPTASSAPTLNLIMSHIEVVQVQQ